MSHFDDRSELRYVEGTLPDEARAEMRRHAATCQVCRERWDAMRLGAARMGELDVAMEPQAVQRVETALRRAVVSQRTARRTTRLAVAASIVAVAVFWSVDRPVRDPAGGLEATARRVANAGGSGSEPRRGGTHPTRFERAALDLQEQFAVGSLRFDLTSRSPSEVRRWVGAHSHLGVSLPVERPSDEKAAFVVSGASIVAVDGAEAVAVGYFVDGVPTLLLTTGQGSLPGAPRPWDGAGKPVVHRTAGRRRLLAWTNFGQVYILVSELPGLGQRACHVCHTGANRRMEIDSLGSGI